jgi:hypothetical protein
LGETKPTPSPRSQSWKPRSQPLPTADKTSALTKNRNSIGAGVTKVAPAVNFVKKQRSPSPSVAQLQEQIFVTKLGVSGDSTEQRAPKPPQKGPTSPSPQVKQLQQIIFSPEKCKGAEQADQPGKSPAAGWWKRVPNAPEIQAEHTENPGWKHEGSSASVCGNELEVSPSPTMCSEPLPTKNAWKKPITETSPGAPTWLIDVAAFHSNSPRAKRPSHPPVWQPQQQKVPQARKPSTPQVVEARHQSAHASRKFYDEGSSELMVADSTSTTSKNDVCVYQEDSKSLIQMAADSVLISDYEQAMQRVVVDSRSDDDDESNGNSAGNTLPSELPLEFQKALTLEEDAERKQKPDQIDAIEVAMAAECEEPKEQESEAQSVQNENENDQEDELSFEEESDACAPALEDSVCKLPSHYHVDNVPAQIASTVCNQSEQQGPDSASGVIFSDPTSYGAIVTDDIAKNKPNITDRAKALLGWTDTRFAQPKYEAMQDEERNAVEDQDRLQNEAERTIVTSPTLSEGSDAMAYHQPDESSDQHDENGFPHEQHELASPYEPNENGFPCEQDENGFPYEQDENGFLFSPLVDESIPSAFGASDFHTDGFGNQDWIHESSDEKKDASELLQYWEPQIDSLNASSEWVTRDPGLDSVPMTSPGPVTVTAENVILTAQKMLTKFSNPDPLELEQYHLYSIAREEGADHPVDRWVEQSRSYNVPSSHITSADMWDLQAPPAPAAEEYAPSPTQRLMQHLPDEAAWRSPDRRMSGHNMMPHEPVAMADPMWGSAQTIEVTWGSPAQPDPFSTDPQFDDIIPGKRPQGDAFDPFGDEDDAFTSFHHSERLFSEPEFVAVDSFSPPPAFAPKLQEQRPAGN